MLVLVVVTCFKGVVMGVACGTLLLVGKMKRVSVVITPSKSIVNCKIIGYNNQIYSFQEIHSPIENLKLDERLLVCQPIDIH
jgi:hypothetical protein